MLKYFYFGSMDGNGIWPGYCKFVVADAPSNSKHDQLESSLYSPLTKAQFIL